MKIVIILFFGLAAFLTIGMLLLAPIGFYSGFDVLTSFLPISLILGVGLAISGTLYYFIEKRQN
jgi:hypothetical protein